MACVFAFEHYKLKVALFWLGCYPMITSLTLCSSSLDKVLVNIIKY